MVLLMLGVVSLVVDALADALPVEKVAGMGVAEMGNVEVSGREVGKAVVVPVAVAVDDVDMLDAGGLGVAVVGEVWGPVEVVAVAGVVVTALIGVLGLALVGGEMRAVGRVREVVANFSGS